MTKYDEQFKLSVVQEYLAGTLGFKALGKKYGLRPSMLSRWVQWFQAHGTEGLKKKFTSYSAEFKLSVLQHLWENGLSYGQAATLYNIRNPGILSSWERAYRSGGIEALEPRPKGRPKMTAPPNQPKVPEDDKRSREDLLAELNHLRMENAYLKKLRALVQAKQKSAPPTKRK